MKTIIKRDITDLRDKHSDDVIIKDLFDKVVLAAPKRCFLGKSNKILIRNYNISKAHDSWVKSNTLMLGVNMWSLITYAEISIKDSQSSLEYEIDITRFVLSHILFLFLFCFIAFFVVLKGTNNIVNALEIGGLALGAFAVMTGINILIKYSAHRDLVEVFIADMRSKYSASN